MKMNLKYQGTRKRDPPRTTKPEVQLSKEAWRDLKEWYEKRSPYMTTESFLMHLADKLGIDLIINRNRS